MEETILEAFRDGRETKVGDFKVVVGVEEEVMGFDVSVEDATCVAVEEGRDELMEIATGGGFRELGSAVVKDLGKEIPAGGKIHDEIDLGSGGHELMEMNDVGMGKAAHGGDLGDDAIGETSTDDLSFVQDFDGDLGAVGEGLSLVDLGKASAAEEMADLVLSDEDITGFRGSRAG